MEGVEDTLRTLEGVRRGWGAGSNASEGGYSVSDVGDMGTVQEQPCAFDPSGVATPPLQDLDDQGIAAGGEAATIATTGTFTGADLPVPAGPPPGLPLAPRIGWAASSYAGSDVGSQDGISQGGSSYAWESGGAARDHEGGILRAPSDTGSDMGFDGARRGWGASSNASEGGSSYAGDLGAGVAAVADWSGVPTQTGGAARDHEGGGLRAPSDAGSDAGFEGARRGWGASSNASEGGSSYAGDLKLGADWETLE